MDEIAVRAMVSLWFPMLLAIGFNWWQEDRDFWRSVGQTFATGLFGVAASCPTVVGALIWWVHRWLTS